MPQQIAAPENWHHDYEEEKDQIGKLNAERILVLYRDR